MVVYAPRQSREAGVALITVTIVLALLMGLAVALTTSVVMDTNLRGAFQRTTTGFYAAESGLNRGMGDYRNLFLRFHVPTGSDFSQHSFTLGTRTVNYQLTNVAGNPQTVVIPPGQVFGGLNSQQYTYIVNSQAIAPSSDVEANVGAEFDVGYIPLFQFVAFYANDLEILPGADMHLHGRVHTNRNLYLNSDAHLWIEDNPPNITTVQVTAKGNVYRGRKNTSTCTGTVTVDMLLDADHNGNLDPRDMPCNGTTTRQVPVPELASWQGSIVGGIQSISIPEPDIIAKGQGVYWQNADLRIVLNLGVTVTPPAVPLLTNANGPLFRIEVQDAAGNIDATQTTRLVQFMQDQNYLTGVNSWNNTVSNGAKAQPIFYTDVPRAANCSTHAQVTTAACYSPTFVNDGRVYGNMLGDVDWRRGAFWNQREASFMYLLNINLHDLLDWNSRQPSTNRFFDPADATDGGIVIFATVQGPNSNTRNNYGVRVFGSTSLPFPVLADLTGVTLVSDQAIYLQGNFNNTGTKQPAAIVGDSVNVLSQNYFSGSGCSNDCQSTMPLSDSSRNASSTVVNTAFLGGVDTTTPGNYNGGLENYPRFHENWGGQSLTYLGSFVSLGTPGHVDGAWCGTGNTCGIYNPPARIWDYDPDFNDVAKLPPLTPRFVYVQQVWFTEQFQ